MINLSALCSDASQINVEETMSMLNISKTLSIIDMRSLGELDDKQYRSGAMRDG